MRGGRHAGVRLALTAAVTFSLFTSLLFGFIYWRTAVVELRRVDNGVERDARALAESTPEGLLRSIRIRMAADFHRITFAAVLDADGRPLEGNLERLPPGLTVDGQAHRTEMAVPGAGTEDVVMVGRRLTDGRLLVLGRSIDSLANLHAALIRALELAILPAVLLSLVAGAVMSRPLQSQIRAIQLATRRIIQGDLSGRLALSGSGDQFDRLASSVNFMLDEIARLLHQAQSTADNIAHDLRTPLTRVRTHLERGRAPGKTHADLQEAVDRAIVGLDQALRVITALLRIGHVERGHRRANFVAVDLGTVVTEIADLFEPFAEEKGLRLRVDIAAPASIHGDRDLLCEAVANLVDNAVKFTPSGGTVTLGLHRRDGVPVIVVADTGPGIPVEERAAVMGRFYRSDMSRQVEGCGLGLSLVDAIVTLHGFRLAIGDGHPGCVVEMACAAAPVRALDPAASH